MAIVLAIQKVAIALNPAMISPKDHTVIGVNLVTGVIQL